MTETAGRRRPGRPPGRRRDEILTAAMDEFAEGGFHGTSLATIAERVGLTQQGLLHYFPSKESLLVAVLAKRDEIDAASIDRVSELPGYVEVVERNVARRGLVQIYTVLSAESVTEGHPARTYFHDRFASLRGAISQMLRGRYGERLPSGIRPEDAATMLIALMDGLQLQWLHESEAVDMPALVQMFNDILTSPSRGGTADNTGD